MLPGPKVFRSRWSAIFWAAGIVWFAVDVAGSAPRDTGGNQATLTDADGETINAADIAAVANLVGG